MKSFSLISICVCGLFLVGCHQPPTAHKQPEAELPSKRLATVRSAYQGAIPSKGIKQTTFEEALLCKNHYTERQDYDLVTKYIEHMLTLTKSHTIMGDLILELADAYLKLGNRGKARSRYTEYRTLYPGGEHIKYALYQEIITHDLDTLDFFRDQTKTREVIDLSKQFLAEFPHDEEYHEKVEELMRKSYRTLLQHEWDIAQFYLTKYEYDPQHKFIVAARSRLMHAQEEYAETLGISFPPIPAVDDTTLEQLQAIVTQLEKLLFARNTTIQEHHHIRKPNKPPFATVQSCGDTCTTKNSDHTENSW